MKPSILLSLAISVIFFFTSCNGKIAKSRSDMPPVIFPDYVAVTIPCNIAPINFGVKGATGILARFKLSGKEVLSAEGSECIHIDEQEWKSMLLESKGKTLDVVVSVWSPTCPEGVEYTAFPISVSSDGIDSHLAYRLIPPGYEQWKNMGIYQRGLSSFEEDAIVTNDQNHRGCVNCHSFREFSSKEMLFHARGKNGGTVIWSQNRLNKIDLESLPGGKSGTYPYWHPSGRYVAFSSNVTRQSFYGHSRNKIEVYDLSSDLMIYDREKGVVLNDPRFSEKNNWETFPSFSPDGKYLYFCTAKSRTMPTDGKHLKYSICRVAFDAASGKLGEQIDTIFNGVEEGKSASFPRISPDGRFLLYTLADCATFPIHHKDSDIALIDLRSMKNIETKELNSEDVDSYHSWSSNGKWIVFSSKRLDGRYTRLFFSRFCEDGKFTKPFLLPQEHPLHNSLRIYSYNIPEFIDGEVQLSRDAVAELF